MPVQRRYGHRQDKLKQVNGLYVHSSPPRVLQSNSAQIKYLIRAGDVEKLENLVYDGQGKKLLRETSSDPKTKAFLKSVPGLMAKISLLHDAVNSGRLEELQSLLEEEEEKNRKRLILAKDDSGACLLHKAVYYDLKDIYEWIIKTYPGVVTSKDIEGKTAYHYTAMCQNPGAIQKLLKMAGADPSALDNSQHSAKYYKDHISELELPSTHKQSSNLRRGTIVKESINIKKSNIRIWIHQRDINSLQQVVWEGHGGKLLVEHSNNPRVKRFLENVPQILGAIRDVHSDVLNDNLEGLKEHTNSPAPNILFIAKDSNGLTPLHKAAGLGKQEMAEYIIAHNPKSLTCSDNEGRTPLHYSVLAKDGGKMFDYLIEAGADEGAIDNKSKSAAFYKTRLNELDSKLLHVIPECPRKAKENSQIDWGILGVAATPSEEMAKAIPDVNGEIENDEAPEENNNEEPGDDEVEQNGVDADEQKKEEESEVQAPEETTPENKAPEEPEVLAEDDAPDEPNSVEEESVAVAEDLTTADEVAATVNDVEEPPVDPEEPALEKPKEPAESKETENEAKNEAQGEAENETAKDEEAVVEDNNNEDEPKQADEGEEADMEPEANKENVGNDNDAIIEPEEVIEGIVNGENEIESVNEEGQDANNTQKDDSEITAMIEEGNMEQLASLVLNGEGERLAGHSSDVPELQSFLDNVPVYMSKINKIHMAARNGNLKELQAALDRRKFAIAKDKVSPNGASPLHVATIFGNTSVVRYLAGRFPETVAVTDDNGRTPLHYAAVVPDNGHYYNLLVHLGANTRADDKFGHTPEFYKTNQADFSHKLLLQEFGAEELSDELLSDKESNNGPVEMPFFCTEEGRYLASSLGDPLIKGLTEVANKRPEDPIAFLAQYLYNFANSSNNRAKSRGRTQENHALRSSNSNIVPPNIDVVTVEPDESLMDEESAFSSTSRDEHGQSMLHFAAARTHGRNALFQLLVESDINIGYRDELYRTARDISIQANIAENTVEIDRYLLHIASKGDTDKLVELLLDGYDHIIDIIDEEGVPIIDAINNANQPNTVAFLHSILAFEERRERVHHAIREGNLNEIRSLLADEKETGSGKLLAIGKNSYGRCTLHIAVLCQQEEIVDYLANTFPDTLKIGDNLERTALHYAMGVEKIESISRVLIKAGATRVLKDLKGRQPTYYFMNKSDILRLQEEEETF